MRGLTLRVTNTSATAQVITDLPTQQVLTPGQVRDLLYTDEVQASLEFGSINGLLITSKIQVSFVSGTNLSQAPIGRMFTGSSPTQIGVRGLVPTAASLDTTRYLKGDGTWATISPLSIGAIPESKLTQQGDLLVRGTTTSQRLPQGNLGDVFRVGVSGPGWQDIAQAGLLSARPTASAFFAGTLYWATDTSILYICFDNGSGYSWGDTGAGNITINTAAPLTGGGVGTVFNLGIAPGTTGGLFTYSGAAWGNLPAGTNGYGLVMVGGLPTWVPIVPTSRTISTTGGIVGGGDLSANRTLQIGFPSQPDGSLIARIAGDWVTVPVGTATQVLTVVGGIPTWAAAPGSSGIVTENFSCPALVAVGDAVYLSASDTVDQANATAEATMPCVGVIISKPTAITCVVVMVGSIPGYVGLTPVATYFVGLVAGTLVSTVVGYPTGSVVQRIGYARNSTTLIVNIDRDYTVI